MQDWGWMENPNLIYGIWSSQFFTETRIRIIKNADCFLGSRTFVPTSWMCLTVPQNWKLCRWMLVCEWSKSRSCDHRRTLFSGQSPAVHFWRNEAVTKMIIRGRRPTVRHVSRTHKVSLDWLFDRINLYSPKYKSNMLTPRTNLRTCWP